MSEQTTNNVLNVDFGAQTAAAPISFSHPTTFVQERRRGYVAGPMRGYPNFNYPSFDRVTSHFRDKGWEIRSPAEKDLNDGFAGNLDEFDIRAAMQWDLSAVLWADSILLLPGFELSQGAKMEALVARASGKTPILIHFSDNINKSVAKVISEEITWERMDALFGVLVPDIVKLLNISMADHEQLIKEKATVAPEITSAVLKAHELVNGERQSVYGSPFDDFSRTAKIWGAITGREFTPEEVALMMIGVKLSRLSQSPHHVDSVVDVAGYAETLFRVIREREVRNAQEGLNQFISDIDNHGIVPTPFWTEPDYLQDLQDDLEKLGLDEDQDG